MKKWKLGGGIIYNGFVDRIEINKIYSRSIAGLCILKPIKNYYQSQPIKVYEYMAAGLPYICSNFPEWIRVAQDSGAGLYVDPEDVLELQATITWFLNNREEAEKMGKLGREYVIRKCNWRIEERTLFSLYQDLGEELND